MERGQRHSKLMQIFDLENDFLRHRQKIIKTQRKDAAQHLKKSYHSQMDMINSFRKNWAHSTQFKEVEKQREISHCNKLLQESILKQYRRPNETIKSIRHLSSTINQNSASRVSLSSSSSRRASEKINMENLRLMKKITSMESHLAKDKMDVMYQKSKANRERLEVFSGKNKQRVKRSLRKMNIEPTVYFPKMKQKLSTIK